MLAAAQCWGKIISTLREAWERVMAVSAVHQPEIEYPSSDGTPLAETDIHVREIVALLTTLQMFFESRDGVYVAANNFIYYEEGNPAARFSPDVYVVFGVGKETRPVFKLWEEKPPSVIFEASSRGTWLEDAGNKKTLCQVLGVKEYFLFDPERDYLKPPLQGFRLLDGKMISIEPDRQGCLFSEELRLKLRLSDEGYLRLILPDTAEILPRLRDYKMRAEASEAKARADAEARRTAEVEIARLKAELKKLKG